MLAKEAQISWNFEAMRKVLSSFYRSDISLALWQHYRLGSVKFQSDQTVLNPYLTDFTVVPFTEIMTWMSNHNHVFFYEMQVCVLFHALTQRRLNLLDLSVCKSHNVSVPHPTMHHFVKAMCTYMCIFQL